MFVAYYERTMIKYGFLILWLCSFMGTYGQQKNLDFFIASGIAKSPLLKEYINQTKSNSIDSLRIDAGYKPQVIASSTNTYSPTYKGWGYESAITNGGNFNQLISVSKRLVSKDNLHKQYEAINLQNQSLNVSSKITEQDIRKSVTAQYIVAYGVQQQWVFNTEMLRLLNQEEEVLKKLTEKNVYKQTDYLSFLVTLQQQKLSGTQIKMQLQNELTALYYLSGINDTAFITLTAPDIQPIIVPDIEHTVFYEQYKIDSLKLLNSDAIIELNYKPKVNLYADAGHISSFALDPYKNFGFSFGASVVMPIYDGKQKKMQHDKNAISENTRSNYAGYFKSQYKQQIMQQLQQLKLNEQLMAEATAQLKYSEALIEANQKLLLIGEAKITDYILAIGNYLTSKNMITQAGINKLQIINEINYWNSK